MNNLGTKEQGKKVYEKLVRIMGSTSSDLTVKLPHPDFLDLQAYIRHTTPTEVIGKRYTSRKIQLTVFISAVKREVSIIWREANKGASWVVRSKGGNKSDQTLTDFFNTVGDLTTPQYTNKEAQAAVTKLVTDLKSIGYWDRAVSIFTYVGGSGSQHAVDLKNPLDTSKHLIFNGGWTHSGTGAISNGTNAYANSRIDLNADIPSYSFLGASYLRSASIAGGDYYLFGVQGSGPSVGLDLYATNRMFATMANSVTTIVVNPASGFTGLIGISAYHNNKFSVYRNTNLEAQNTNSRAEGSYHPATDPNNPRTLYLSAYNNNGSPVFYLGAERAFDIFGPGVDQSTWNQLQSAINLFQTSLNRNV